jgi:Tol biopolymer transport system component
VLFLSEAANLVPGDTNNQTDVFVHNLVTGRTTRVNVASDGAQSARPADGRSISGDGRYVVFNTSATDLVAGAPPDQQNVYLHDLRTGRTTLASRGIAGRPTNEGSFDPLITADGRFVVFDTAATNVVPGATSGRLEVFVRNLRTGRTRLVSRNSGGVQANADCQPVSVSAHGRYVLFFTSATNLVRGATGGVYHLYVRDREAGRTTPIDVAVGGGLANDATNEGRLSADGRFVVFSTLATNLVAGDTNDRADVFVRDRSTGRTTRVNLTAGGLQAMGGESFDAAISTDGRHVAFSSGAANLVPNDTNATFDVFVRDRG